MIIVKLTILLTAATLLYGFIVRMYALGNQKERIKIAFDSDYRPRYLIALGFMVLLDIIGIFASVIWALFFR